jgi:hypothetical protein
LLVGKVAGIGLLALIQAAAMVVVFLGLSAAVGSSLVHGAAPGIVITGAVFLVLGYAFYCTAFAAGGSLVSRQSDVGTVILPVQIPLMVAYALSYTVICQRRQRLLPGARLPAAHRSGGHAGAVRRGRRAHLAGGDLRRPVRGRDRVDGPGRGAYLRPVDPAHWFARPAA